MYQKRSLQHLLFAPLTKDAEENFLCEKFIEKRSENNCIESSYSET